MRVRGSFSYTGPERRAQARHRNHIEVLLAVLVGYLLSLVVDPNNVGVWTSLLEAIQWLP